MASRTTVVTTAHAPLESAREITLMLRGEDVSAETRRVQWDEEVIDNEHLGKRSSKSELRYFLCQTALGRITTVRSVCRFHRLFWSSLAECCIYHKRKPFDESDSEDSSDKDDATSKSPSEPRDGVPIGRVVGGVPIQPRKPKIKEKPETGTSVLDPDNCDHCAYLTALITKSSVPEAAPAPATTS